MHNIKVYIRKNFGKSASRRIRLEDNFPAIIYGNKKNKVLFIKIENNIFFNHELNNTKLYSNTYNLILKNKNIKVKIKEIQMHPFKKKIYHIDFLRIEK